MQDQDLGTSAMKSDQLPPKASNEETKVLQKAPSPKAMLRYEPYNDDSSLS